MREGEAEQEVEPEGEPAAEQEAEAEGEPEAQTQAKAQCVVVLVGVTVSVPRACLMRHMLCRLGHLRRIGKQSSSGGESRKKIARKQTHK